MELEEEMISDIKEIQPFFYRSIAEVLIEKGYRKESDTAREVLTLIKNGVELNSMIDGDAKTAIMNELRWAGQKYGVDLGE